MEVTASTGVRHLKDVVHPVLANWDDLDHEEGSIEALSPEELPDEGLQEEAAAEEEGLLAALQHLEAGKSGSMAAAATTDDHLAVSPQESSLAAAAAPSQLEDPSPKPNALLEWPLYALSEELRELSILNYISRVPDRSGPIGLSSFEDCSGVQPVDFYHLRQDASLAIAVAMLWGYLPSSMVCQCGGPMQLRATPSDRYKRDTVAWYCINKGYVKQWTHTKKKKVCQGVKSVRFGTWLTKIWAPVGNILEGIFFWCTEGITQKTIGKFTSLNDKQVWRLTRACRLTAAKFMLENPELNRIGGHDANGKPIVCQVDETHCGKMKHHRGKPRVATWVLGGVEAKSKEDPARPRKFFAMTVPDRKRKTLIPVLKYMIKEDTLVWTDGWPSYFTLGSHFSGWDYVNHKNGFIDKSTGVHTNDCEGAWKWMKETIPDGSPRSKVEEYVQLHCFKKWLKAHPHWDTMGFVGGLGRASAQWAGQ